jgi:hypothetical protein
MASQIRERPDGPATGVAGEQGTHGHCQACTYIAMRATKLNAQVQLTTPNLQTMYERGTATSDQRRQLELEYQDWARLQGRGTHTAGGHGRNRHVGWQS